MTSGFISQTLCFRQPEMRSSFNDLLMALSILNIIYVFTGIVDYTFVKVIKAIANLS